MKPTAEEFAREYYQLDSSGIESVKMKSAIRFAERYAEEVFKGKSIQPVIRRLPTAEEVKRWHQILTGLGEEKMKSDIEATFV